MMTEADVNYGGVTDEDEVKENVTGCSEDAEFDEEEVETDEYSDEPESCFDMITDEFANVCSGIVTGVFAGAVIGGIMGGIATLLDEI